MFRNRTPQNYFCSDLGYYLKKPNNNRRLGVIRHMPSLSWGMYLFSSFFNHPVYKPVKSSAISLVQIAQLSSCCFKLQVQTSPKLPPDCVCIACAALAASTAAWPLISNTFIHGKKGSGILCLQLQTRRGPSRRCKAL